MAVNGQAVAGSYTNGAPAYVSYSGATAGQYVCINITTNAPDLHFIPEVGFQRLLDLPGYDIAALVEKSGKSASHIYARLSLLQLIPEVAEAFMQERITASHANLIARLPQESQAEAFEQCWRKDWQDSEPHLLPARHVSAWIQNNLYLALADAPFDREDATLNPAAGACVTCPRRSGYNTSLFSDVVDGKPHRMAPRLCLEESLKVCQNSPQRAARYPGGHSPVSRGGR